VPDNIGLLYRRHLAMFGPREMLLSSNEPVVRQFLNGQRQGPIGMAEEKDAGELAAEAAGGGELGKLPPIPEQLPTSDGRIRETQRKPGSWLIEHGVVPPAGSFAGLGVEGLPETKGDGPTGWTGDSPPKADGAAAQPARPLRSRVGSDEASQDEAPAEAPEASSRPLTPRTTDPAAAEAEDRTAAPPRTTTPRKRTARGASTGGGVDVLEDEAPAKRPATKTAAARRRSGS
jgi:hypothetical protein